MCVLLLKAGIKTGDKRMFSDSDHQSQGQSRHWKPLHRHYL